MTIPRTLAVGVAVLALLAGCGGNGPSSPRSTSTTAEAGADTAYGAQIASYDLSTEGPQRFLVGLLGSDNGLIVGGEVRLDFRYFGEAGSATSKRSEGELVLKGVTATFQPVAGGVAPPAGDGPRLRKGDEGVGVYEATGVEFDRAGVWEASIRARMGRKTQTLTGAFEVMKEHGIVAAGDPAPRTVNHLPGAAGVPARAVDSRAKADGTVPDPELHRMTVADAIATGRPTLVVVSTPVFCVSRFCGPITDSIDDIAAKVGPAANYVHIEVWRDFEEQALNAGAAEWIYPDRTGEAAEPWVFLVDGKGTVVQRWDNVANQERVESALRELVG